MPAVEVAGVNKSFRSGFLGWKRVLKNVNLSIEEGALYGILGPKPGGGLFEAMSNALVNCKFRIWKNKLYIV